MLHFYKRRFCIDKESVHVSLIQAIWTGITLVIHSCVHGTRTNKNDNYKYSFLILHHTILQKGLPTDLLRLAPCVAFQAFRRCPMKIFLFAFRSARSSGSISSSHFSQQYVTCSPSLVSGNNWLSMVGTRSVNMICNLETVCSRVNIREMSNKTIVLFPIITL